MIHKIEIRKLATALAVEAMQSLQVEPTADTLWAIVEVFMPIIEEWLVDKNNTSC